MVVVAEQDRVDLPELIGGIAGPAVFSEPVPQPNRYLPPGGSKVGSVRSRQPPASISNVGPPMCVSRTSMP